MAALAAANGPPIIQELHQDLVALSERRLRDIDYLNSSLQANLDSLKKLLDKKPRNDPSKAALASGKIEVSGVEYHLNNEFQSQASSLADILFLDQIESAALLLEGQAKAEALDRPPWVCAALQFHERRSFVADSLRLMLKLQLDMDMDDNARGLIMAALRSITHVGHTREPDGSVIMRKCLPAMMDIQKSLDSVNEHIQKVMALGNVSSPDLDEVMGFQQQHLTQQHEALGTIVAYIAKAKYVSQADFSQVQEQMRQVDKWNNLAVHYVPALIQFSAMFSVNEGMATREEAIAMHKQTLDARTNRPWPLRSLQAAAFVWWLGEFSSWFTDADDNLLEGPDADQEAQARDKALMDALRDGAFECTISICLGCMPGDWYDAARTGLARALIGDAPLVPPEPNPISPYFRGVAMEGIASFTEAFITNMPDILRQFKQDEEDQRQRNLASFQPNLQGNAVQEDRHLERFLIITSYAYGGRPGSALVFWEDQGSNLYGFLEWFSKRVSTALVGALCQMFRSLSEGEESAEHAHTFLLEDAQLPPSRARRATALSWSQIFDELEFYAAKVRESPNSSNATPNVFPGKSKAIESDEPETPVMLESYLQLTAHLCRQSPQIRSWILSNPKINVLDTAFLLCHGTVPARVRACALSCVQALLSDKTHDLSDNVWVAFDQWVSSGFTQGLQIPRPVRGISGASGWTEEATLDAISSDFDETVALVSLLQQLVAPPLGTAFLSDCLPFPEQLGSSYRMPGIEPYIDLVMGKILTQNVPKLDTSFHSYVLATRILQFIETCLESFNEGILHLTTKANKNFDDCLSSSSLAAYIRLHPFTRTIEWLFNEKVVSILFKLAHEDISEVNVAAGNSPRMVALTDAIKVMTLVMDLQSTFFDIVRPMIKGQPSGRSQSVISPAISCFEDCVSANLRVVVDIAYYCGSGNQDLALASTELLKRLSKSRKLNTMQRTIIGPRTSTNRLIVVLQQNQDIEPVARPLKQIMDVDVRELEFAHDSPEFKIKYAILDFLETTLSAYPDQPCLAHVLLGFQCTGTSVTVSPDGLFAKRTSLFHAILKLSTEYPDSIDGSILYWCVSLKSKAADIVQLLWASPLTSANVLADLRTGSLFFTEWLKIVSIGPSLPWEGQDSQQQDFIFTDAARTFDRFLALRSNLLAYAATELRSIAGKGFTTLNTAMVSTLLGRTETAAGGISNATILDLLDFLDIEPPTSGAGPARGLLAGVDFAPCLEDGPGRVERFNMPLLDQLLSIEGHCLRKRGVVKDETTEEKLMIEIQDVRAYANGWNNSQTLERGKINALEIWADLVTLFLVNEQIAKPDRVVLVLQILQLIAPRMEMYAYSTKTEGVVFARLTQTLFSHLDLSPGDLDDERAAEVAQIRLFQLFKNCLRAITNPDALPVLHEILYSICYHYLTKLVGAHASNADVLQAVGTVGGGLINVICDDAYGGNGPIRVGASLLLAAMAELAADVASSHIVDALVRNNFMTVLIDVIREIPSDLSGASPQDIALLVATFHGKLALLLAICKTRDGATQVLASGLFAAIQESGLFALDPDIGLNMDDQSALKRFYELLVNVLQVIVTIVMSCGPQNEHVRATVRAFLSGNRPLMVGVFKRQARIVAYQKGSAEVEAEAALKEAAELYVLLISITGFMKDVDGQDQGHGRRMVFT